MLFRLKSVAAEPAGRLGGRELDRVPGEIGLRVAVELAKAAMA